MSLAKAAKRRVCDAAVVVNHVARQVGKTLSKDLSKAGTQQRGLAAAAALAAEGPESPPLDAAGEARLRDCLCRAAVAILERVMLMKHAYPFNEPVDAEALKLADYHKVIARPMDLGTVKRRAQAGEYAQAEEVLADVQLVFDNAMRYNPPGSDVWVMAASLHERFHEVWKLKVPARLAEEEAAAKQEEQAAGRRLGELQRTRDLAAYRLKCQELQKFLGDLETRLGDVNQQLVISCQDLGPHEKAELSDALNDLPTDLMDGAVNIVARRHADVVASATPSAAGEVRLPVESLDPVTLRLLQRYVHAATSMSEDPTPVGQEMDAWTVLMESLTKAPLLRHRPWKRAAAAAAPAEGDPAAPVDILS